MDKKTIVLGVPLKHGDETISELHIHRPKAADFKRVTVGKDTNQIGLILELVGGQNGLPPSVMDEMDGADAVEVMDAFAPFLEKATGGMPSA